MIHHKIKIAYHHIRHTRPNWYHEYHKWEHHGTLHMVTLITSLFVMFFGFASAVILIRQYPLKLASAATTTVTANVVAGTLGIASQASANLSQVNINVASMPQSSGNIGNVIVTDNRGNGVGWSSTATMTDFTYVNQAVMVSGSNNTVTRDASSTYSNATAGTYTITVDTGGALGTARFDVTGLETVNDVMTTVGGQDIAIGTRGVLADFGAATYVIGDSWTIRVDTIPNAASVITIDPGSLVVDAGSGTNVSAGTSHGYTGTGDPATLMTASTAGGYGMGQYHVDPSLTVTIPTAVYANNYTSTMTQTVN